MTKYDSTRPYKACPVCFGVDQEHCTQIEVAGDSFGFDCFVCGQFCVSGTALADYSESDRLRLTEKASAYLSHKLRLKSDGGENEKSDMPLLTSSFLEDLRRSPPSLPLVSEQLRNLVRAIGRESLDSTGSIFPNGRHKARAGCLSMGSLQGLFESGVENGVLRKLGDGRRKSSRGHVILGSEYVLTMKGWNEFESGPAFPK